MAFAHDTPQQEEAAQEQQTQLRKDRIGNTGALKIAELRESQRYHAQQALEHRGTEKGADHAAAAYSLSERLKERFELEPVAEGAGGEYIPVVDRDNKNIFRAPTLPYDIGGQLQDRDMVRRGASRDRLDMLVNADALALGIECAESVGADDAVSKMLSHEMAVAHTLGLKFAAQASSMLAGVLDWQSDARQQVQCIEACRLANTSAKMMKAVADASEALQKHKGGTPQRIHVTHTHVHQQVQVNKGGQAVVNGALNGTAGRGRELKK